MNDSSTTVSCRNEFACAFMAAGFQLEAQFTDGTVRLSHSDMVAEQTEALAAEITPDLLCIRYSGSTPPPEVMSIPLG